MVDSGNWGTVATEVVMLFPACVWCTQLKEPDYQMINAKIRNKLVELTADEPALAPRQKWQTEQKLHRLEEFRELNGFIHACAGSILDYLKVVHEGIEITGCWANISAALARHEAHHHPNNYVSGVYYVQVAKGADSITFIDPRREAHMIEPRRTEDRPQNSPKATLRVREGSLVMFPAWLVHMVEPKMSECERIRISVSFNIMFSAFTEKLAKPTWDGNLRVK